MRPVLPYVLAHLPATLELSAGALLLSLLVGLPLGMLSAIRRGSLWDSLSVTLALFAQSLPLLDRRDANLHVSVQWHLLPSQAAARSRTLFAEHHARDRVSGTDHAPDPIRMLEVLGQDYIRTAWAKGLSAAEW